MSDQRRDRAQDVMEDKEACHTSEYDHRNDQVHPPAQQALAEASLQRNSKSDGWLSTETGAKHCRSVLPNRVPLVDTADLNRRRWKPKLLHGDLELVHAKKTVSLSILC